MKILPNWYCTSQLLSFLYNYYLSYYYSMYLRLLYNSIFNYYCCYYYAINWPSTLDLYMNQAVILFLVILLLIIKNTRIKLDICFINLEGLFKKTFCFTFKQFFGTFEYMQMIGLFTLVEIQIILTG